MALLLGRQLDFNRLQALNLVVHSTILSAPPSTPVKGQLWYVSDIDVLKAYTGSTWNSLVIGPATSVSGKVPTWNGSSGGILNDGLDVVTAINTPGVDTALPTEQAVREAITNALAGDVSFKGPYDAATNTPDLDVSPSGVKIGNMYYVSVGGTFFTEVVEAGDVLISKQDDPTTLAHWTVIQKNLPAIVPVTNGGTGIDTFTAYSILASGITATGALTQIAEATQYKALLSGTVSSYPTWSPYTLPPTVVINSMWYAVSSTEVGSIAAPAATGMFLRNISGVPGWSTLVLPNAGTVGDIPIVSATDVVTMLTSVATAGSFLRSGGITTAPQWSSVKLPDTMSALGVWVANATNTVINLTVSANQSIRLNAGGTAWEAWNTTGTGSHSILDGSVHSDSLAGTVLRGSLIVGNSTPKWALLAFQASGATGYVLATDLSDSKWTKQRFVEKLSTAATSYDITHNLGTRRVKVTCQDTTNNQNILVGWVCKSGDENNTITVTFGRAPLANTRIITVFGINYSNALDTSN